MVDITARLISSSDPLSEGYWAGRSLLQADDDVGTEPTARIVSPKGSRTSSRAATSKSARSREAHCLYPHVHQPLLVRGKPQTEKARHERAAE
jgi:hypothetical protein